MMARGSGSVPPSFIAVLCHPMADMVINFSPDDDCDKSEEGCERQIVVDVWMYSLFITCSCCGVCGFPNLFLDILIGVVCLRGLS